MNLYNLITKRTIKIPMFTVDYLIQTYSFDHVDIIHTDVQGAEYKAMLGAAESIKNDLIDAVIGLTAKLFYGTGIPAAILILNRNKPKHKKSKILIIDGEHDYLEGKNQNSLRQKDIDKIVQAYDNYKDIDKYCIVRAPKV